jgi:hypothetical protein
MDYPIQETSLARSEGRIADGFDMRNYLMPKRLTAVMWDFAFITRHVKGDSFEDYDRVLDEAIERGYNTIRIDPMPHLVDLSKPEQMHSRPALSKEPINPWDRPEAFEGPAGAWLIEFMEKLLDKGLYYCLSAWSIFSFPGNSPQNLSDISESWKGTLREWRRRFGFDRCLYVDLSNEYPYCLNHHLERTLQNNVVRWSPECNEKIKQEVDGCLRALRDEFPEPRFMVSLHGDVRWIDLQFDLDVMDIHFVTTQVASRLGRSPGVVGRPAHRY